MRERVGVSDGRFWRGGVRSHGFVWRGAWVWFEGSGRGEGGVWKNDDVGGVMGRSGSPDCRTEVYGTWGMGIEPAIRPEVT